MAPFYAAHVSYTDNRQNLELCALLHQKECFMTQHLSPLAMMDHSVHWVHSFAIISVPFGTRRGKGVKKFLGKPETVFAARWIDELCAVVDRLTLSMTAARGSIMRQLVKKQPGVPGKTG